MTLPWWVVFYGFLIVCFLSMGVSSPGYAGAFFVIFPLTLTMLVVYFTKSVEEAFKIAIVGLVIGGVMSLIPFMIISNSFSPEEEFIVGAQTIYLASIWASFFVTQVPLTFVGMILGLVGRELQKFLWPQERRIRTFGDFTSEGVTRMGVEKVRLIGTVPEELVEWMQREIEAGNYVNQSHMLEVALQQLKEREKTNH